MYFSSIVPKAERNIKALEEGFNYVGKWLEQELGKKGARRAVGCRLWIYIVLR